MRIMQKPLFLLLIFALLAGTVFSVEFIDTVKWLVDSFKALVPMGAAFLIIVAAIMYMFAQIGSAEQRARMIVWSTTLLTGVVIGLIIYLVFTSMLQIAQVGLEEYSDSVLEPVFGAGFTEKYVEFIILSLLLGIIMTVSFYFTAYFFQHPPLYAVAKDSLGSDLLSIVIILSWFGLSALFSQLTQGIMCIGAGDNPALADLCSRADIHGFTHVDLAYMSLDLLYAKLKSLYTSLYLYEVLIGFLSTITFPLGSPLPALNLITLSFTPYDGLVILSNAHTVIVEAIGYLITAIIAKQFLLEFARKAVPLIIIPFGILLRSFPFYRTTGSSLIAIGIVAYFVYPLAVLFSNYLIFDLYQPKDFTFVPEVSSLFHEGTISPDPHCAPGADYVTSGQCEPNEQISELLHTVYQSDDLVGRGVREESGSSGFLSNVVNVLASIKDIVVGFVKNVYTIGKFMWTSFGGDIMSFLFGGGLLASLTPVSSMAGFYRFIIEEVVTMGAFLGLVTFTSVIEIIFTITMYRNISALIAGEVELIGLQKLV